jgi:hypothetical protein
MLQSVGDEGAAAAPLTFLIRRYASSGRNDIGDAVGQSLAEAIDRFERQPLAANGAEWLVVFLEATRISEDARLLAAARALAASIRSSWPSRGEVAPAMQAVDACLAAAQFVGEDAAPAASVDELERIIGIAYTPGRGLARSLSEGSDQPGRLIDHVTAVSALLTGYSLTERLPYSMLAEELMQFARRSWWDDAAGRFRPLDGDRSAHDRPVRDLEFAASCAAGRALCRLAALHDDAAYRRAAVIAAEADYALDACRTLQSLQDGYRTAGTDAAIYGLALIEYEALRRSPKC